MGNTSDPNPTTSSEQSTANSQHALPDMDTLEETLTVPPTRLLDKDLSKFRSLKRVIVVGRPGSGVDGVGDALKELGFKVYDFQAASDRYERDFPFWLEATNLRQTSQSYNKSDYDKLLGDHNAVVGAPACFFDQDLVKLYPNVKVILVTRDTHSDVVAKLLKNVTSRFWQRFDPVYFGNLSQFLMLHAQSDKNTCINNEQIIHETVREKDLLEICNLIAWVPLCEFLGVPIPQVSAPELHDDTISAQLRARPLRAIMEKARRLGGRTITMLTNISTMTAITLASVLAVLLGSVGLFIVSGYSLQLVSFLMARSQIRDVTRLLAFGISFCALITGFFAGYSLALWRKPSVPPTSSPRRGNQHRNNTGYRKGRQGRERQAERQKEVLENTRPKRPTLEEWNRVQEDIRNEDARMLGEGKATLEEWRDGKHVTFHVTHKHTKSGQALYSGPRKILSVTEETI